MQGYFASLKAHQTTAPWQADMLDFDQLNALIGTPELLAQGGLYARLWARQSGGFLGEEAETADEDMDGLALTVPT